MRICSARMKKDLCILAAHLGMRPLPPKTRKNVHRNAPLLFPYLHFFLPGVNSDALGYGNLTYLSQKNNPTGDASFPFDQASKNRSRIWNGSRDIDNRICDGNDREVWCFVQCKLPSPPPKKKAGSDQIFTSWSCMLISEDGSPLHLSPLSSAKQWKWVFD